jgi:hypothetical protein
MATDCFAGFWWERWARKCVELIIKSYDLVGPTSKTHGGGKHFLAFTSLTTILIRESWIEKNAMH